MPGGRAFHRDLEPTGTGGDYDDLAAAPRPAAHGTSRAKYASRDRSKSRAPYRQLTPSPRVTSASARTGQLSPWLDRLKYVPMHPMGAQTGVHGTREARECALSHRPKM